MDHNETFKVPLIILYRYSNKFSHTTILIFVTVEIWLLVLGAKQKEKCWILNEILRSQCNIHNLNHLVSDTHKVIHYWGQMTGISLLEKIASYSYVLVVTKLDVSWIQCIFGVIYLCNASFWSVMSAWHAWFKSLTILFGNVALILLQVSLHCLLRLWWPRPFGW